MFQYLSQLDADVQDLMSRVMQNLKQIIAFEV